MSFYGRKFVPQSTITRRMDQKDARINRELQARLVAAVLPADTWPYASLEIVKVDGTIERHTPATYAAAIAAELFDVREDDGAQLEDDGRDQHEDDFAGTRCGAGCGYCGRCS